MNYLVIIKHLYIIFGRYYLIILNPSFIVNQTSSYLLNQTILNFNLILISILFFDSGIKSGKFLAERFRKNIDLKSLTKEYLYQRLFPIIYLNSVSLMIFIYISWFHLKNINIFKKNYGIILSNMFFIENYTSFTNSV